MSGNQLNIKSNKLHENEEYYDSDHEEYDNFIHIGKSKVNKDDLLKSLCFSKTLTAGNPYLQYNFSNDSQVQAQAQEKVEPKKSRFADPTPLGLCSFALTTLLFSFTNARTMGIEKENIVAGLGFFYGGFIQFVAGVLCFITGDTFSCCAFSSYGGFWMSWAAIHTDAFGIKSAYGDNVQQFNDAMGLYNISWAIFTFMMALCTLKDTCYFCSLLWIVTVVFTLNGTSKFTNSVAVAKAGGVMGIIAAFLAFFIAYTALSTPENSYIHVKDIMMPQFGKHNKKVEDLESK